MELYYHYPKKNKKLEKLVQDPLFQQLAEYLYGKTEAVILRELKRVFPEKRFEKLLDTAISFSLIQRENRRYHLSFPVFQSQELPADLAAALDALTSDLLLQEREQQAQNVAGIWEAWFAEADYFFATTFPIAFYEKRQAGNDSLSFIHFAQEQQYEKNLVDYLLVMERGDLVPAGLKGLEASIGDVHPKYLFDQFEVIFENVQSHKRIRSSIFTKALIETSVISEDCSAILLPELTSTTFPNALEKELLSQETKAVYQRLLAYRQLLNKLDKRALSLWKRDTEK